MRGIANKKTALLGAVLLTTCAPSVQALSVLPLLKRALHLGETRTARVAWITLSGPITSAQPLADKLIAAHKNNEIEAILLHIESPGGTVGASELLHRLVKEIAAEKPIVVLVENYCTSGAYWTACGATTIIIPSAADIGSIGVVSQIERHKDIEIKNQQYKGKAEIEIFQAGKYKTLTHRYAGPLTDADREELNEHIQKIYAIFTGAVAQTRHLDLEKKAEWAEGRVFIGRDAVELGLADIEGGLAEAIEELKRQIKRAKNSVVTDIEFVKEKTT